MKNFWLHKKDCSGCGMCANICPKKAIVISEDDCGFYYPVIKNTCIDCNTCETACHSRTNPKGSHLDYPLAFACWSNDQDIRFKSTSGGAFSEIVSPILKAHGFVAGAAYDSENRVVHTIISDESDLEKIRQSKYVQSFSGDVYTQAKKTLDSGDKLVFCGTPCQVSALLAYLKKPYENLFTIDFICRGVNSPKAYRSWLSELEKKYKSKAKSIWFKYKENGWKASPYSCKISFNNDKDIVVNGKNNLFMTGYLGPNLYIRPSCGSCHFKGFPRSSDITLADYWGIDPNIDDDKGVSLVIVNSNKGKTLLETAKNNMTVIEKNFFESIKGNQCYYRSVPISQESERFFSSLKHHSFSESISPYLQTDKKRHTTNKVFQHFFFVAKKLSHYFLCVLRIINAFFHALFKNLHNSFLALLRLFNCLILLSKKPTDNTSYRDLNNYYPDPGKLSETKGYRHNPDLDLSVIIPVYNVEKYIEECLNSVISQKTDYKYEVILVDDGSTDNTAKLIAPYLSDNIKLLTQENRGQSVARNNALCKSRGKYIMFVDGDDVLLPGAIQNLITAAKTNNADIAEGNLIWFNDEIPQKVIDDNRTKPHTESYAKKPKFVLSCSGYSVAKVYKRKLWETVRFPEGYIFEDTISRYVLRRKANKVVFTGEPVYAYRRNPSSSTHSGMSLKMLDCLWVFNRYIEMCKEQNAPFDKTFYAMAISDLGLNIVILKIEDSELKTTCFKRLCEEFNLIYKYKAGRLPVFLKLLELSLKSGNMAAWEYTAKTILDLDLIKAYRERA